MCIFNELLIVFDNLWLLYKSENLWFNFQVYIPDFKLMGPAFIVKITFISVLLSEFNSFSVLPLLMF